MSGTLFREFTPLLHFLMLALGLDESVSVVSDPLLLYSGGRPFKMKVDLIAKCGCYGIRMMPLLFLYKNQSSAMRSLHIPMLLKKLGVHFPCQCKSSNYLIKLCLKKKVGLCVLPLLSNHSCYYHYLFISSMHECRHER